MACVSLPWTLTLSFKIGHFCPRSLRMPKRQEQVSRREPWQLYKSLLSIASLPPTPIQSYRVREIDSLKKQGEGPTGAGHQGLSCKPSIGRVGRAHGSGASRTVSTPPDTQGGSRPKDGSPPPTGPWLALVTKAATHSGPSELLSDCLEM